MSEQPETIQRVRNAEYRTTPDGARSKRKLHPDGSYSRWEPVSPPLPPAPGPILLILVLENQTEGEPKHWFLFVGPENGPGTVYQVTGDATFMRYETFKVASPVSSGSYCTSYVMARLEGAQAEVVRSCAEGEAPPRAADRASVRENCQGWTMRVLRRLRDAEVVHPLQLILPERIQEHV